MRSFDQFLAVLSEISDPRRAEGKVYKLPYLLLFSVLAVIRQQFLPLHRSARSRLSLRR
jgi:hypothetical protein